MENRKSVISNRQSQIVRYLVIAATLLLAFAIGHFGLRPAIVERGARGRVARALNGIPVPPDSMLVGVPDFAPGTGRIMVRYRSSEPAGAVEEFYRREMPALGWTTRATPGMMDASGGEALKFADPTGSWCIISITEAGACGGSYVSIMRMASAPSPGPAETGPKEESR
jgi:hypothetical protein